MGKAEFEVLLGRMTEIANAVNAFTSEAIQREVFTALISAYSDTKSLSPSPTPTPHKVAAESHTQTSDKVSSTEQIDRGSAIPAKPSKVRKSNSGTKTSGFKVILDLDLRPDGKQSFADFVASKAPSSNEDKYAVAVYYLEHILELPSITSDHVGTVFRRFQDWREPKNLRTGLTMTTYRKGTILTADLENIRTTSEGRNFVEHDLPRPTKPVKPAK